MPVQARLELEGGYRLQSHPNPVREWATVELAVKEAQDVTVAVYDVLGRQRPPWFQHLPHPRLLETLIPNPVVESGHE